MHKDHHYSRNTNFDGRFHNWTVPYIYIEIACIYIQHVSISILHVDMTIETIQWFIRSSLFILDFLTRRNATNKSIPAIKTTSIQRPTCIHRPPKNFPSLQCMLIITFIQRPPVSKDHTLYVP